MNTSRIADLVQTGRLDVAFTRSEALAAGLTEAQLRGRSVDAVFRGVYCLAGRATEPAVRAVAAEKAAGPDARLCETTALALLGVALPSDDLLMTVHIWMPAWAGPRMSGIRVHRDERRRPYRQLPHGLLALNPAECWLQAAETLTVRDLVVLADGLMRRQDPILFQDDLEAVLAGVTGRRGVRAARKALSLARPGTDSPMETLLRLALIDDGLPCPEVNLPVRLPGRGGDYSLDMAYPDVKVGVEYDGAYHGEVLRQMRHDQTRRRRFEDAGWRVITATAADLPDTTSVVASVRHELTVRGALPAGRTPSRRH